MRLPRTEASIRFRLLPTRSGGRHSPTPGRKWKCRLKIDGLFFDALLVNRLDASFHPGEDAEAEVTFLQPDLAPTRAHFSHTVELWELRMVGTGVLADDLDRVRAAS